MPLWQLLPLLVHAVLFGGGYGASAVRAARRAARMMPGMDLGIEGRTAVVTGATRGIGAAVAELLEAEGARVVRVARSEGIDVTAPDARRADRGRAPAARSTSSSTTRARRRSSRSTSSPTPTGTRRSSST